MTLSDSDPHNNLAIVVFVMVSYGRLVIILACLMKVACPDSSSSKLTDDKQIRKQSKRNSNCIIGFNVIICGDGNTEVIEGTESPGEKKTSGQKATTKNKKHSTKETTKTTSPTSTSTTTPKLETEAKKSKSHNETKEKTDSPAPTENGNGNAMDKNETIKAESQTGSVSSKAEDAQIGTLNLVAASNIFLSVIAIMLNMLITPYNIHDRMNLSSTLFLKKGLCDWLSALGFLLQVPSVVSILNKDTPVSLPLVSYWIRGRSHMTSSNFRHFLPPSPPLVIIRHQSKTPPKFQR